MVESNQSLKSTPPLLIGMGLLLWGWQCDYLVYAVVMGVLLESAHWIEWRISVSDKEFNYISDISSIFFLIVVIYIFTTHSVHGIFSILSLLPFLFFMLILAQVYSLQGKIKPSALFISLRRLDGDKIVGTNYGIDLSYPYLILCLISSSAGNHQALFYFISMCLLVLIMLWSYRPRRYHISIWLILVLLSISSAYAGQYGIRVLQNTIENSFLGWFDRFMWRSRDPQRTVTAIGSIGKLKESDRILVRVDTENKLDSPLLLREAVYSTYGYGIWTNPDDTFTPVDPIVKGRRWLINETNHPLENVKISFYFDEVLVVIPAPQGTTEIKNVDATDLLASPYGPIKLESRKEWIEYDALYNTGQLFDSGPDQEDLEIPAVYSKDLAGIISRLNLSDLTDSEKLSTIEQFFAENFQYSLTQTQRYPRGKYLIKFLTETKEGHCEFFATATALLLRAAGIPSRYVIGYSIQEYSPLEGQYIARARHMHSWVLAFINNEWKIIDTTPAIWVPLEDSDRSAIEPLIDLWAWFSYKLSTWNSGYQEDKKSFSLIWLLAALLIIFIYRLLKMKKIDKKIFHQGRSKYNFAQFGADSSFYRLMQELEKEYFPREPDEPVTTWIKRIEKYFPAQDLQSIVSLHYRYRFDPDRQNNTIKKELDFRVNNIQI